MRLSPAAVEVHQRRELNANRAVVTKVKRKLFERVFPATLVWPDGSTSQHFKHATPRKLVKLPVNFEECSPEMQKRIRLLRTPRSSVEKQKDFVDAKYDPMKYIK